MIERDLTADEISAFARALHGAEHGAIRALSQQLGIQYDTLRKAASGSRRLGPHHTALLRALMREHASRPPIQISVTIARPPASLLPEADRDEPCGQALDPALDALAQAARTAGWHPAEIAAAVLGWATTSIMDGAGPEQALASLEDAAEMIRLAERG